jgi:pimeloyl-ACP methyl ester carboxylesterase
MKRRTLSMCRVTVALLLVMVLAACVQPGSQAGSAPQGALSFNDLLAKLDALQGPAARSLTLSGASIFTTPSGSAISLRDLSSYLNAIKQDLGSYVQSLTGGSPYFVLPTKVSSYPSTDANGQPLALSGLVWVPFTWGRHLAAPIISLQHGTQVFRQCAPSQFDANPLSVFSNPDQSGALQNYVECLVGGLMASAGYIVLMPDYPGFGQSTAPHPFVHTSLGNSVRDLIVAARARLTGAVTPNGKLFLTGYSEGGYATMAGAKVVAAAGIPVTGVVPCDGPYDLSGVMLDQMVSGTSVKAPFYVLYTAFGYHSVYPSAVDYNALLNPPWNGMLSAQNGLFDGNHTDAQVNAAVPPSVIPTSMLAPGATALLSPPSGAIYDLLASNNGYANWGVTAKLVFVHCPSDDIIPYQNSVVAAAALGAQIVPVQPVPFIAQVAGSTHVAAFPTAILAAFTAIQGMNQGF